MDLALWTEGDPRSSVSHQELRAPKEGPETPPGLALGRCWAQGHLGFVGRVFRQQRIHQGTPVTCTERPPPSTVVNTPRISSNLTGGPTAPVSRPGGAGLASAPVRPLS